MPRRLLAVAGIIALLLANTGIALAANNTTGSTGEITAAERCEQDVTKAQDDVDPNTACTMVVQTLQCPYDESYTHQARNGCIASNLQAMGWERTSPDSVEEAQCERVVTEAQQAAAQQDVCTEQTMKLQCPSNDDYTYQAANGCEISYLQKQGWTDVDAEARPPRPPGDIKPGEPPEPPSRATLQQRVAMLERQVALLRKQVRTLSKVIQEQHDIEKNITDDIEAPPRPPSGEEIANRSTGPPEKPGRSGERGPPPGLLGRLANLFG